jgi:hypothetical protein
MSSAEREKLKDNLRAMIAGRGDSIDLDTPFRWVVEGVPGNQNLSSAALHRGSCLTQSFIYEST